MLEWYTGDQPTIRCEELMSFEKLKKRPFSYKTRTVLLSETYFISNFFLAKWCLRLIITFINDLYYSDKYEK